MRQVNCYHVTGRILIFSNVRPGGDHVYLCEGFSTGATIAEATGATVICAFNAESLPKVARVLKGLYLGRKISIATDNDQFKAAERRDKKRQKGRFPTTFIRGNEI